MQTLHAFNPDSNRYAFDFELCSARHGWAQLDTSQDASYYGNWANPFTLQVVTYQEGDETLQTSETEQEFTDAVRAVKSSQEACGHTFKGIDTLLRTDADARFKALGLGDLLYPQPC